MFSGTTACGELCQPAASRITRAMAPGLGSRFGSMTPNVRSNLNYYSSWSMLTVGMTNAAPVPRAGQMKIEFGVTQVGTAPADHAVGLGIRASSTHFATSAQLGFGQTRLTPRVREPAKPSAL